MEDLADVEREKKETKLQILKPDAYDGTVESNPTYQRWYETINNYLYHIRGSWEGDSDLIRVWVPLCKERPRTGTTIKLANYDRIGRLTPSLLLFWLWTKGSRPPMSAIWHTQKCIESSTKDQS